MKAFTDASGDVHLVLSGDAYEPQALWAVLDHAAQVDFVPGKMRTPNEVMVGEAVHDAAAALRTELDGRIERCARTGTVNQLSPLTSTGR